MIDREKAAEFFESLTERQKKILKETFFTEKVEPTKYKSVNEYIKIIDQHYLHGSSTSEVYGAYKNFCWGNGFIPISHIEFSRALTKCFPVKIIDKKINGEKYRVFASIDGRG